jgi:predicted NAD/FAD-dependent oxidoreductase
MEAGGDAAPWGGAHVGVPGMSGALRGMAEGIERRQGWEAREVRREGGGWVLRSGDDAVPARELISTVPVTQARALLGHEVGAALEGASMAPCWTLLAFVEMPVETVRGEGDAAWLCDEGSKPGRSAGGVVLQASAEWTRPRLEMDRDEACEALLGLLPAKAVWARAHRWRYSQADRPLGRPFVAAPGLRVGGDWCLGTRLEDAFASGTAMARDLLASDAPAS